MRGCLANVRVRRSQGSVASFARLSHGAIGWLASFARVSARRIRGVGFVRAVLHGKSARLTAIPAGLGSFCDLAPAVSGGHAAILAGLGLFRDFAITRSAPCSGRPARDNPQSFHASMVDHERRHVLRWPYGVFHVVMAAWGSIRPKERTDRAMIDGMTMLCAHGLKEALSRAQPPADSHPPNCQRSL
jgi:hypothetical protein